MAKKVKSSGYQLPLTGLLPKSDWVAPRVADLPSWRDARRVCVDVETCDPLLTKLGPGVRRGSFICGVGFRIADHDRGYYLPIRHEGGDNLDPEAVMDYLRDQFAQFTGDWVNAKNGYDGDHLAEEGVPVFSPRIRWRDVCTLEAVLSELHDSYGLEAILERRGLPGKDETMLREAALQYGFDPKKELWRLPGRFVAQYGTGDVDRPLLLLEQQEAELAKADSEAKGHGPKLAEAWDLESRLGPVVCKMSRRGVRVDQDQLAKVEEWTFREEKEAWAIVHHHTGVHLNVGDADKKELLGAALKYIGMELSYTPRTNKIQITKETLAEADHPVATAIARARKFSKIRTTFCKGVRDHMTRGRVHGTINQVRTDDDEGEVKGTRSYRTSMTHPNMQNQPSPDRDPEVGTEWRRVWVPERGEKWLSCDLSQDEPRVMVHFADKLGLPGAHEMAERYRNDPDTHFHKTTAALTNLPYFIAKETGLGLAYSMGGAALCKNKLHLPTKWIEVRDKRTGGTRQLEVAGDEGQAILDTFNRLLPWLKKLQEVCTRKAERRGWIRLITGHLSRFPRDGTGKFDWTHKALNRLVQGSCAGKMKLAMVLADEAGLPTSLTVHDELTMSMAAPAQGDQLVDIMENCIQLGIPCRVSRKVGPSWGDAKVAG